jgi:ubiquinone/menaquinone biosynthesis C-methylase UbiE
MTVTDKVHFKMMSFVHETLYGLFRDPYKALAAAGLEAGQRVLEVGCGPGFFTVPAARVVGEQGGVWALDVNPLAIQKVLDKIERAGVTNVETVLTDASQTGLPGQSFDLAFLFGFSHHTGDLEPIMTEMHRLLRPGGTLAVEGPLRPAGDLFRFVKRSGTISQFCKSRE